MKRYLLGFLLALPLFSAPTITVSANSQTLLGVAQPISITVDLTDPNSTGLLRDLGGHEITIMTASSTTPGTTATVGPIFGQDQIRDGFGNLNSTYYRVRIFPVFNNIVSSTAAFQQFFAFTGAGTVDLATATPLAPSFMTGTGGSVSVPGNLTATAGQNTFNAYKLDNVFMMDGLKYPCTTAGIQAIIADAITAGGGMVDARFCQGANSISITSQINVGNLSQTPITLYMPLATWTVTGITDGTSCAIKQFGGTRIIGPNTPGAGAAVIHAGAGTNNLKALYCTDTTQNSYLAVSAMQFYNPNGATMATAAMDVEKVIDGGTFQDITVASYGTVGVYLKNCVINHWEGLTSNGNHVANSVPLKIDVGNTAITFHNSSIDHPGATFNDIVVLGGTGANITDVNFDNLYMEGNNTDTTTPLILLTNVASAVFHNTYANALSAGASTAAIISSSNTTVANTLNVDNIRLLGNFTLPDTSAIIDSTVPFTTATDVNGRVGYYTNRKAIINGLTGVSTNGVLQTGPVSVTSNAGTVNGFEITDTEASGKTIFFGPGVQAVGRASLIDATDGPNTELFSCNLSTAGQCGAKVVEVGASGANASLGTGSLGYLEVAAPSGIAGIDVCYGDSGSHVLKCSYNNGTFFNVPQVIASGTSTLNSGSLTTNTCQATVTTAATGAATTDSIEWAAATVPGSADALTTVWAAPTSGNVNFVRCNPTNASQTTTAIVVNWRVVR